MGKIEGGEERLKTYTPLFILLENKILFIYIDIFIKPNILIVQFLEISISTNNMINNEKNK
jgi:hypothetical protein